MCISGILASCCLHGIEFPYFTGHLPSMYTQPTYQVLFSGRVVYGLETEIYFCLVPMRLCNKGHISNILIKENVPKWPLEWSPPWKVPDIDYLPYPSFVTYSLDTLLCLSTQPNHFFVEKIMNRLCFKMAFVQHFKGRFIQLWRIKTKKPIKYWNFKLELKISLRQRRIK